MSILWCSLLFDRPQASSSRPRRTLISILIFRLYPGLAVWNGGTILWLVGNRYFSPLSSMCLAFVFVDSVYLSRKNFVCSKCNSQLYTPFILSILYWFLLSYETKFPVRPEIPVLSPLLFFFLFTDKCILWSQLCWSFIRFRSNLVKYSTSFGVSLN